MPFNRRIASGLVALGLIGSTAVAISQVRPGRHPNLAAAQRLAAQASARVSDAQRANEYDMGGHAAHAKQLLDQASEELNLAAGAANRN